MPNESPRVVLITGCSSGIGRATARRFLQAGWHVWATARDPTDIADLETAGCRTAALDVTDHEQIDDVVDRILERDGHIDGLVNNAGFGQTGAIEEVPIHRFREQFEVNVFGPIRLTQAVLPSMRTNDRGRIVNVSSLLGRVVYPTRGAYAASKHALEAVSEALRDELVNTEIDVVIVEPGSVQTSFEEHLRATESTLDDHGSYRDIRRRVDQATRMAVKRGLPPERVADVIYSASTTEKPKLRYTVGTDALIGLWADRLVPRTVKEWIFRLLS